MARKKNKSKKKASSSAKKGKKRKLKKKKLVNSKLEKKSEAKGKRKGKNKARDSSKKKKVEGKKGKSRKSKKSNNSKSSKSKNSEATPAMLSKIEELMSFRQIPWMIDQGQVPNAEEFTQKLVRLQVSIYQLDHYLETQWIIEQKKLEMCWKDINKALAVFGLDQDSRTEWSKQIARYQAHELDLRSGKSPSRFRLRHYYYYKSCDVRLLRKLIYQASTLPSKDKLSDWTDFDLITEVHDDISDLGEDQNLLNGNRFLFGLHEGGKRATDREFRTFIRTVELSVRRRMKGRLSTEESHIKKLTLDAIKSTRELLRQMLSKVEVGDLANARVFQARSADTQQNNGS